MSMKFSYEEVNVKNFKIYLKYKKGIGAKNDFFFLKNTPYKFIKKFSKIFFLPMKEKVAKYEREVNLTIKLFFIKKEKINFKVASLR